MSIKPLPRVRISESDYRGLCSVAEQALKERHPVAGFLISELARAELCDEEDLPADAVAINRSVAFRPDIGWPLESRMLVYPDDYVSSDLHVSVMSPLGAALLGLRPGSRMPYLTIEGLFHMATVETFAPRARRPAPVSHGHAAVS